MSFVVKATFFLKQIQSILFLFSFASKSFRFFHILDQKLKKEVRKIAKMCLEKAARDGFTTLSFPALGTGVYNYSGAEPAKGLFDAIIEFSDTNLLVKKIDIVLFEGARQDVREVLICNYHLIEIVSMYCKPTNSIAMHIENDKVASFNF